MTTELTTELTSVQDSTISVEIRNPDGSIYVIPVDPSAIQYEETGARPIGVVTPIAEIGSEFIGVVPISATEK
jgi:hypothetical protein